MGRGQFSPLRALGWVVAGFLVGVPAGAMHLDYEGLVDRFEVTGNMVGGLSDDFDDGVVAPWSTFFGTASESGGFLHLTDPGFVDLQLTPGLPLVAERSDAAAPATFNVADGAGSFGGTSTWTMALPDTDEVFGMNIGYDTTSQHESIWAVVANPGAAYAAEFGLAAGLYLSQFKAIGPVGGSTDPGTGSLANVDVAAFLAGDVTGPIMLQISFDDGADAFSVSFSLDGGTTFLSPFGSIPLGGSPVGDMTWALSVLNYEVIPEPNATLLLAMGLVALAVRRPQRA
jgi:hypothetical protein